ncbi:MAG: chorismate mutase [Rhodobacteraceae bacterium]|nr:chorismate mutase [Paracoccaceae bacterium]
MAEIRGEIDRIDRALIGILAERAGFIDRAAEVKSDLGLPARLDDRVAEVMERVTGHSRELGLDPVLAEDIWRRLIDWSIAREERVLNPE